MQEYRSQAVVVEGYLLPYEKPPTKPTVLDVLGPAYHHQAAEVYIDNDVLDGEEVEEKDEILQQGEAERLKRRRGNGRAMSHGADSEDGRLPCSFANSQSNAGLRRSGASPTLTQRIIPSRPTRKVPWRRRPASSSTPADLNTP